MATVAENLQTIIDIKADIKTAIENKGVTVGDASFGEYASKIDSIESSGITSIDVGGLGLKFGNSTFTEIPSIFDFSNVISMYYMFYHCSNLITVPLFDTSNVTDMRLMFNNCYNLTSVPLFNTSNVSEMLGMFEGCENLTTVPLFNTSNVTDMERMFNSCDNLTTVPLFDTSNVTNMKEMFYYCTSLTTVPLFDTSNVNSMRYMFNSCTNLTSVPQFDTSNVDNMAYMFYYCSNLITVPLFDTSNVNNVGSMFDGCENLTNVGGLKDFGKGFYIKNWPAELNFSSCSKLTYESCLNIFNSLYDLTTTSYTRTAKIRFHATPYALLSTDDIAIATNKGWIVESA